MRGQVSDYDGWRDMGNTGWGWADVLPYFKKLENHVGVFWVDALELIHDLYAWSGE